MGSGIDWALLRKEGRVGRLVSEVHSVRPCKRNKSFQATKAGDGAEAKSWGSRDTREQENGGSYEGAVSKNKKPWQLSWDVGRGT
jgi:hypothetical protein